MAASDPTAAAARRTRAARLRSTKPPAAKAARQPPASTDPSRSGARFAARRSVRTETPTRTCTYTESTGCRRVVLLGYYGEHYVPPCGHCDNCRDHDTSLSEDAPFAVGDPVAHGEFGLGTVMIASADRLVVLFDEHGYRTLATDLALAAGYRCAGPATSRSSSSIDP